MNYQRHPSVPTYLSLGKPNLDSCPCHPDEPLHDPQSTFNVPSFFSELMLRDMAASTIFCSTRNIPW